MRLSDWSSGVCSSDLAGSLYYPPAKALAEHGITAFVVHYFDGIPQAHKAAPALHDEREAIVSAAVGYVARQAFVDPDRIGIFGLSLGSFQALSLGSRDRSEEHTPELQSLMRISYAVFCLKNKQQTRARRTNTRTLTYNQTH